MTEQTPTATVVRMSGEIDIETREQARGVLAVVVAGRRPVVVDTTDVTFLGAPGLGLLVDCARVCAEQGVPFALRPPSPHLALLIDRMQLTHVLRVMETADRD